MPPSFALVQLVVKPSTIYFGQQETKNTRKKLHDISAPDFQDRTQNAESIYLYWFSFIFRHMCIQLKVEEYCIPSTFWKTTNHKYVFMFNSLRLVMHLCISKLTIIASDNGLSPDRRQDIYWTNAKVIGTKISETLINLHIFVHENAFEMFIGKLGVILSQPQRIKFSKT